MLDVRLGEGEGSSSGIEKCRDIRSTHPEVACVMLTSFDDDEVAFETVSAVPAACAALGRCLTGMRS